MQKITPFLLMDGRAEEAMNLYTSVFRNSKIVDVSRSGDNGPVFSATLELDGERFILLNVGPKSEFNASVSFFINCETQAEVDELWDKLLAGGGAPMQCGWLKDKFGVHWQIIPSALGRLMRDKDPAKSQRVMQAMMKMVKIDVAGLEAAHRGA
jgi:predicted 3-demethylubiquinone-9 3-methyltransferase (glyoxalase superfamily)